MVFCKLICGDVIDAMAAMEPDSVDLIVTSPPYGVGKDYEVDVSQEVYNKLVNDSCKEFKRVLKPDGRICLNAPFTMNYDNNLRLVLYEWETAILGAGLNIRDIIIWNQSNSGNDTAWGSFKSASSPWLRHQCEGIIVGYNDQWKKIRKGESDITRDEFMKYVVDLWTMPCARNADHPAVFSEELPYRAIKLFSYIGDTVLDPFVGSGTTMKVGLRLKRNVIGIDKEKKYCDIIRNGNWFYQSSLFGDVKYDFVDLTGD